jgi:hypothetical protein
LLKPVVTARHRVPPPWRSILAFIAAGNYPLDGIKTAHCGGALSAVVLIGADGRRKPAARP